jgi:hypothetical protein
MQSVLNFDLPHTPIALNCTTLGFTAMASPLLRSALGFPKVASDTLCFYMLLIPPDVITCHGILRDRQ